METSRLKERSTSDLDHNMTLRLYKGSARLSTSFPYTKVNAIEKLDLPAIEHDHSAGGQSAASSYTRSEREGRQGIPAEEPCFVTRRVGYGLQNVHWANAVRGKENKLAKSTIVRRHSRHLH